METTAGRSARFRPVPSPDESDGSYRKTNITNFLHEQIANRSIHKPSRKSKKAECIYRVGINVFALNRVNDLVHGKKTRSEQSLVFRKIVLVYSSPHNFVSTLAHGIGINDHRSRQKRVDLFKCNVRFVKKKAFKKYTIFFLFFTIRIAFEYYLLIIAVTGNA